MSDRQNGRAQPRRPSVQTAEDVLDVLRRLSVEEQIRFHQLLLARLCKCPKARVLDWLSGLLPEAAWHRLWDELEEQGMRMWEKEVEPELVALLEEQACKEREAGKKESHRQTPAASMARYAILHCLKHHQKKTYGWIAQNTRHGEDGEQISRSTVVSHIKKYEKHLRDGGTPSPCPCDK
jgi:hypothetical protein